MNTYAALFIYEILICFETAVYHTDSKFGAFSKVDKGWITTYNEFELLNVN
jgi:hypothetical protein